MWPTLADRGSQDRGPDPGFVVGSDSATTATPAPVPERLIAANVADTNAAAMEATVAAATAALPSIAARVADTMWRRVRRRVR